MPPIYPLFPIENETLFAVPLIKLDLAVQLFIAGSYSQKLFWAAPEQIYPLFPIENPEQPWLGTPPKFAFCVHVPCPFEVTVKRNKKVIKKNFCCTLLSI